MKVRVDFFKKSGKWYTTHEGVILPPKGDFVYPGDRLLTALRNHLSAKELKYFAGMTAVCIEYEVLGYPALVKIPEAW